MNDLKHIINPLLALAVLGGCETVPPGMLEQSIIKGVPDNHNGVVTIDVANAVSCTGTYLGSGLVLTAAHCFDNQPSNAATRVFFNDTDNPINNKWVNAKSFVTFQSYANKPMQSEDNDLAAVFVDRCDVPSSFSAMTVLNGTNGRVLNASDENKTSVQVVGVGEVQAGPKGENTNPLRRRNVGTMLISSVQTFHVELKANSPSEACWGDSGGPMIVTRDGVELVDGVSSRGEGDCSGTDYYTRLDVNQNAEFLGAASLQAVASLHSCGGSGGSGDNGLHCSAGLARATPRDVVLTAIVWLMVFAVIRRRRWPRTRLS